MADADVKLNRREVLVGGAATLGVSAGCATVGHSPSSNSSSPSSSGAPQTAVPTVPRFRRDSGLRHARSAASEWRCPSSAWA